MIEDTLKEMAATLAEIRDLLKGDKTTVRVPKEPKTEKPKPEPSGLALVGRSLAAEAAKMEVEVKPAPGPTRAAVGQALITLATAKSGPAAYAVLGKFGAAKLQEVPEDRYADLLKAINLAMNIPAANDIKEIDL